MRILFICKSGQSYGYSVGGKTKSSGLYNSTNFVVESLRSHGVCTRIVEVNDNNDIDREVANFQPDRVIIEALWVVPEKFDVLMALYPTIRWYVHMHSAPSFLALEGIAVSWLNGYADRGVGLIANSEQSCEMIRDIIEDKESVTLLHNIYGGSFHSAVSKHSHHYIKIACFGAIRPMKNNLTQALAAIKFAKQEGKQLHFYINAGRVEQGESVLKNLRALFAAEDPSVAILLEVPWMPSEEFRRELRGYDMGMQVSMAETFNIVSADYVAAGLPIVVSDQIPWASSYSYAKDDSIDDIVRIMSRAYNYRSLIRLNQWKLKRATRAAVAAWCDFAFSGR